MKFSENLSAGWLSSTAEAVEKAHPLDHSIPDFWFHQSMQQHA
jgi:hypothetical protein